MNPTKCASMVFATSKQKTPDISNCVVRVNGCIISSISTIKILNIIFTAELDWKEQARVVCSKVSRKLAIIHRLGSSSNTRTRITLYKACIKSNLDYCLPVWACCGAEESQLDKVLIGAKRIVTNSNNTIVKSDFKLYGIAIFADLHTVANARQYFHYVHSPEPNCNITLLSKNTKSMQTRASEYNKAFLSI